MKLPLNEFSVTVDAHLPDHVGAGRWLNAQWDARGRELIPLNEKITNQKYLEAAHRLHRGRKVKLVFRIDKSGGWKLVKRKCELC